MKNRLMEQGDVIVHFIDKENKYQWAYCIKDADKTGKFESMPSTCFFDTKEEAIANLNKYIEEHRLKKSNIIDSR